MNLTIEDQLSLAEFIYNEGVTFMGFSLTKLKSLLEKDYNIQQGIDYLKRSIPKITLSYLDNNDYFAADNIEENVTISGSESIIYFKQDDDELIYKLNNPHLKVSDNSFNHYIWCIILQEYLFPDAGYHDFKIINYFGDDLIFMSQKMFDTNSRPSDNSINSIMKKFGFGFKIQTNSWLNYIRNVLVEISDLNPYNCRIIKGELQAFDPRFNLIKI